MSCKRTRKLHHAGVLASRFMDQLEQRMARATALREKSAMIQARRLGQKFIREK